MNNATLIDALRVLSLMRKQNIITLRCYERVVEKTKQKQYYDALNTLEPRNKEVADLFNKYADCLYDLFKEVN